MSSLSVAAAPKSTFYKAPKWLKANDQITPLLLRTTINLCMRKGVSTDSSIFSQVLQKLLEFILRSKFTENVKELNKYVTNHIPE